MIGFDSHYITRKYNQKNPGYNKYNDTSNFSTIQNLHYTERSFKYSSKIIDVTSFETEQKEDRQIYLNKQPPIIQLARKVSFMSEIINHH